MSLFEAHVTLSTEFAGKVKELLPKLSEWKFSQIDGDPVLGPGSKAYLTSYDTNGYSLRDKLYTVEAILKGCGVPVMRLKIEQIVLDTAHDIDLLKDLMAGSD